MGCPPSSVALLMPGRTPLLRPAYRLSPLFNVQVGGGPSFTAHLMPVIPSTSSYTPLSPIFVLFYAASLLPPLPPFLTHAQVLSLRNAVFDLWRQQGGNLSHLEVYMSDNVHPGR